MFPTNFLCLYIIWMSNNLDLRWSPTFCGVSSGSRLFAKVINGLQNSPLAGWELTSLMELGKIHVYLVKIGYTLKALDAFQKRSGAQKAHIFWKTSKVVVLSYPIIIDSELSLQKSYSTIRLLLPYINLSKIMYFPKKARIRSGWQILSRLDSTEPVFE